MHPDGAILGRQYLAERVKYLAPLIQTYPSNSTLGLVWEDDEEEEEENEVENEEQEEWEEKEGAVKAGFIFYSG